MKKIKIVIHKNGKSFMSKATAYKEYFDSFGNYTVTISDKIPKDGECDVLIYTFGFLPFFKRSYLIVGEYPSLSTGSFPKIKDWIKNKFNPRCDIQVCLNESVKMNLGKKDALIRGMGYFPSLVKKRQDIVYDVVYSGALRDGVNDALIKLAGLGFKVCVVGDFKCEHENITNYGKVDLDTVYEVYSKSKFGLNLVPDIHPYNIQDSTKAVEYVGAGLGVITNDYSWIRNFERNLSTRFLRFDEIDAQVAKKGLPTVNYSESAVSTLQWHEIIESSGLKLEIEKLLNV